MSICRFALAPPALVSFAVLSFLQSCADVEEPFTQEPDTFTVEVQAQPSTSVRSEGTNAFWHADADTFFLTDFSLDGGSHGHDAQPASLELEEDGHGDDHDEEPGADHDDDHADESVVPEEAPTLVGRTRVNGYDVELSVMSPHHRLEWDEVMGMWHEEEPDAHDDRYLMVRLGSSAGTNRHPHAHGHWADTAPYFDDLTEKEKEVAEEDFSGMRQICAPGAVHLTVDGTAYGGGIVVNDQILSAVETSEGARQAGNFVVPDGIYDVSVTVEGSTLSRLSDAEGSWEADVTLQFPGVVVTGADGSLGFDIHGRTIRDLEGGASAQFVVLDNWDGAGHLHPHRLYLENHRGDVSQILADGTNTMVSQIRARAAQNLYDRRVYFSPSEPVSPEAVYLEVTLFDPESLLDHHDDNFYELSNAGVRVTITNDRSGEQLELHPEDLLPTHSHVHGFHYGVNITLPVGAGHEEENEGDGGHDHG